MVVQSCSQKKCCILNAEFCNVVFLTENQQIFGQYYSRISWKMLHTRHFKVFENSLLTENCINCLSTNNLSYLGTGHYIAGIWDVITLLV